MYFQFVWVYHKFNEPTNKEINQATNKANNKQRKPMSDKQTLIYLIGVIELILSCCTQKSHWKMSTGVRYEY